MADRHNVRKKNRNVLPHEELKYLLGTSATTVPNVGFSGRSPFGTPRETREIASLVSSLLNDAFDGLGNPVPNVIMLETLGGGRSGACVLKVTPLSTNGRMRGSASSVIKIAALAAGISEKKNYDQFVRPLLPTPYRPDLRGFATVHNRAALCYEFVGDGDRPETLTDRLAAGDLAVLDLVLSSTFDKLRQHWYNANQRQPETNLARYYLERYFENHGSATATETVLFGHAARYFNATRDAQGYRIGNIRFPHICEALFEGRGTGAYKSCILHGDLNSDNVILNRNNKIAALVDFQRTGRGHVFQDLASLEASVRINYPEHSAFGDILEIERLIALNDPRIRENSYAMAIYRIRDAARQIFHLDETPYTYQFAVAAIGLRLMKATDLSDAACARIIASALWAVQALMKI